uniref:Uncharacterized protein n=1 Tax=Siphoviridae sp. ct5kv15 TaxID=2825338 RepID=A0A8S5PKU3_9CAUD|nr:MAG TPA: hypothetical protein [Siphoviridae sp. ct5kv15]
MLRQQSDPGRQQERKRIILRSWSKVPGVLPILPGKIMWKEVEIVEY